MIQRSKSSTRAEPRSSKCSRDSLASLWAGPSPPRPGRSSDPTDFSTVQLACTMELSHPRLRSWFACGDFEQRITENGLQDISEIEWLAQMLGQQVEIQEVRIAYRHGRADMERWPTAAVCISRPVLRTPDARPAPERHSDSRAACRQRAGSPHGSEPRSSGQWPPRDVPWRCGLTC